MCEKVLSYYIDKNTKSIALMDEFEEADAFFHKIYETLKLNRVFCVRSEEGALYWITLYIKRMDWDKEYIYSNLTFTSLKRYLLNKSFSEEDRNSYAIIDEVLDGIKLIEKEEKEIYHFPKPVKFNAQNSGNRTGYGNEYRGSNLIYKGTLYGETSNYMFVAAEYRRWS